LMVWNNSSRLLRRADRLSVRIALASLAGGVVALIVVGVGVSWAGYELFRGLMVAHGESSATARRGMREAAASRQAGPTGAV
ncbi:MAG: hypothetical protein J2P44_04945, partial [Candidatus Dormibacteraeota bacterium]|nr:hypothetical protein [Candidatus Dormibacteraeota bacterium]